MYSRCGGMLPSNGFFSGITHMSDYLAELNDSQLAAVKYVDGPSLVIAGAGSGKTKVLVSKVTYLLEHGYKPWNILALTFTNKAAREMKERIARQVGEDVASALWAGTFHSVFSRILRVESAATGFDSNFTIYDAADQKNLLKDIIKGMGLDDKQYKASSVAARISNAKNRLILPDDYASDRQLTLNDAAAKMPAIKSVYQIYWKRCIQAGVMDFDDLLLRTWLLFQEHPEVCLKYAGRFKFILVDEYQDTNYAQDRIVWDLAHLHQHVCVVGDDAQSIYSFRGANIDNILRFQKQYKDTRLFKLEQNYRSTQMIVNAANSLISKNQRQIPKKVYSKNEEGDKIHILKAFSDAEEANLVIKEIRRLHRTENIPYGGFAVLYRTNAQSRVFEEVLRKQAMPYCIYGGLSFYQRKEIKDVIAYFRMTVNPNDEEAFKRVVNYPKRGIGSTTVNKLVEAATDNGVGIWDVACSPSTYGIKMNKGTLAKLGSFIQLIETFREQNKKENADNLGVRIIKESGVAADIYKGDSPDAETRKENLNELVNALGEFVADGQEEGREDLSLSAFLAEASLQSDVDSDEGDSTEKVTLMTVHSAKGLEFPVVFVVGLEEELFPSGRSADNPRALEEERRLFYVAITRAERFCFLSYANNRYRYGSMVFSTPSRFLRDINPEYLVAAEDESPLRSCSPKSVFRKVRSIPDVGGIPHLKLKAVESLTGRLPWQESGGDTAESETSSESITFRGQQLSVGRHIVHDRFGRGVIMEISGSGDSAKVKVSFENSGEKTLLLKFARFTLE